MMGCFMADEMILKMYDMRPELSKKAMHEP
jgi:hypothetical protein